MSNVLAFRPASAVRPASNRQAETPAEIVIFPGVRYERGCVPDNVEPKPNAGGGKPSRRGARRR
jgi:hypothetical protein